MKTQELRQLTTDKLKAKLDEVSRKLAVVRFHLKTGQENDTAQVKKMRRQVAQIKTLLHNEAK